MAKMTAMDEHTERNGSVDHQVMIRKILDEMHMEVDSFEESIIGRMEKVSLRLDSLDSSK